MHRFTVRFSSMEDVLEFVGICSRLSFRILVGNESYYVNGSSFMGLFTLDFNEALSVRVEGTDSDAERFAAEAERFLAN